MRTIVFLALLACACGDTTTEPKKAPSPFKLCNETSPEKCSVVGTEFLTGEGRKKNKVMANIIFTRGCEYKDAKPCAARGRMFAQTAPDDAEEAFKKACDLGDKEACSEAVKLAAAATKARDKNSGLTPEKKKFLTEKEALCKRGDTAECLRLANTYFAAPSDSLKKKAAPLYKTACDGDQLEACYNLGIMYKNGDTVQKSASEAAVLFTKACKGGVPQACAQKQS